MKGIRIGYWISTSLLCLMMVMSAGMYLFTHARVAEVFTHLGYPTYIIYPLAVLKLLGVIAILTRKHPILTEWAYAGFFFDFVLAFFAHFTVGDGEWPPALAVTVLLIVSRVTADRARGPAEG